MSMTRLSRHSFAFELTTKLATINTKQANDTKYTQTQNLAVMLETKSLAWGHTGHFCDTDLRT